MKALASEPRRIWLVSIVVDLRVETAIAVSLELEVVIVVGLKVVVTM